MLHTSNIMVHDSMKYIENLMHIYLTVLQTVYKENTWIENFVVTKEAVSMDNSKVYIVQLFRERLSVKAYVPMPNDFMGNSGYCLSKLPLF